VLDVIVDSRGTLVPEGYVRPMQAGASGVVQKEVIANAERDTVYTERVMQRKRNLYERGFLPLQDAEAAERDW
jgi:hypothetical protein